MPHIPEVSAKESDIAVKLAYSFTERCTAEEDVNEKVGRGERGLVKPTQLRPWLLEPSPRYTLIHFRARRAHR